MLGWLVGGCRARSLMGAVSQGSVQRGNLVRLPDVVARLPVAPQGSRDLVSRLGHAQVRQLANRTRTSRSWARQRDHALQCPTAVALGLYAEQPCRVDAR